jgi:predicted nucleotidyltransferase
MAVALGGSRAAGTQRPDSDWDFSLYYRRRFDPADLRSLGWPGEISRIGGWGGGVFNGGAWLRADGRPVDVHYRDLDDVEHHLAEAREGRFRVERLLFHLAGVPTYIVVAELAVHVVLHGELPSPEGTRTGSARQRTSAGWPTRDIPLVTRGPRTPAAVTWPRPPARSRSPSPRGRTRHSPPAVSGSLTRRRCSTGPGCAAATACWPA